LLFLAIPHGEERGRLFCWERGSDRLTAYQQEEPYPYDVRWLTDDKLLCCREGMCWTADLESAELIGLDFVEGYLAIDVAPDGNRILLKEQAQVLTVRRSERWRWSLDGQSMVYAQSDDDRLSLLRIELQSKITKVIGPLAELKDVAELIVV
jgi:hypothetical protein